MNPGRPLSPHPLLLLARRAIEAQVRGLKFSALSGPQAPSPPRACFVSLKAAGRLRGCIGTLSPVRASLELEVAENAMAAATRDPRFPPVRPDELARLRLSIDVLNPPEAVSSEQELDPLRYGLVLRQGNRCGVLLPDIPGVGSVRRQIEICREKAGVAPDAPVALERFTVERIGE